MKKIIGLVASMIILTGCQAWVEPISNGDKDSEAWIFVNKPGGDFERNGVYHCTSETGVPVCQKARMRNK